MICPGWALCMLSIGSVHVSICSGPFCFRSQRVCAHRDSCFPKSAHGKCVFASNGRNAMANFSAIPHVGRIWPGAQRCRRPLLVWLGVGEPRFSWRGPLGCRTGDAPPQATESEKRHELLPPCLSGAMSPALVLFAEFGSWCHLACLARSSLISHRSHPLGVCFRS